MNEVCGYGGENTEENLELCKEDYLEESAKSHPHGRRETMYWMNIDKQILLYDYQRCLSFVNKPVCQVSKDIHLTLIPRTSIQEANFFFSIYMSLIFNAIPIFIWWRIRYTQKTHIYNKNDH